MKGGEYISSYKVGEKPALFKSSCIACQNKSICKSIASRVAALGADQVLGHSSPAFKKKYAAIADHLRREGFSYPNVINASTCWMHSKFGVAVFYENQLATLADKSLTVSVPSPAIMVHESSLGKRSYERNDPRL